MAFIGAAVGAIGSAVGGMSMGTAVSLIGTGLSVYSGLAAASEQRRTEDFNRIIAERNMKAQKGAADMQYKLQMAQAGAAMQQAEMTSAMQQWDANMQRTLLKSQMDADFRNGQVAGAESREDVRRQRAEMMRRMAVTNNKFAKAGVVGGVGTPLEILSDTAEIQGSMASEYTLAAGRAQSKIDQFAATSGRMNANRKADLSWWSVKNAPSQAPAMRTAAIAGGISGAASAYGSAAASNQTTPGSTYNIYNYG